MADQSQDAPKAGRPFLFTDPKELDLKIQNYFDECDPHTVKRLAENGLNQKGETIFMEREVLTEQKPYTITGLARALKVTRETLKNYRNPNHYSDDIDPEIRQQLIDSIENAYIRVEEYNEVALHRSGISAGIKFNLTNNFGWIDKQVVENNNRDVKGALDDLEDDKADLADEAKKELEADDGSGPAPQE